MIFIKDTTFVTLICYSLNFSGAQKNESQNETTKVQWLEIEDKTKTGIKEDKQKTVKSLTFRQKNKNPGS